ncbi:hypothetical protein PV08_03564 [Exophiala spinifera]|uniref:Zn(2)-C6 fungal-type domain-containing protein n=1 Tax=Exophiala spinifera TaxID=91928 RepID=A0A0D2BKY9_9EURO|nr:uncharacterized protein PV08_03564 [Exophiala spinifera]KIW19270.1 hypothetical protein PV08_03564 [Exophiala spinifera]
MESVRSPAGDPRPRLDHACVRCSERKVKCDRRQPCESCMRHSAECIFRPLPPRKRRKKRTTEEALIQRLHMYEELLEKNGVDANTLAMSTRPMTSPQSSHESFRVNHPADLNSPDMRALSPERGITKPRLLHEHGRSKYLNSGLWTRVMEEFREPGDALGDSSDEDSGPGELADAAADVILGSLGTPASVDELHPPADQIMELWQIYLRNVSPVIKLLHAPTTARAIQNAVVNPEKISRAFEALLFAIYSAAVMSLRDEESKQRFGQTRKHLLSRYIRATKLALTRAKLMGTSNLVVLQAYLLHLVAVREFYDSRTLWNMLGVAVRIGEGMGLHRDGSALGLPPFDAEIRRRIWWEMSLLDDRSGDLSGYGRVFVFEGSTNIPKAPANVDDDKLFPSMTSMPEESTKVTESLYCALRAEMFSYWIVYVSQKRKERMSGDIVSRLESPDVLKERDKAVEDFEQMIESKYVRYLDPSQPLQLLSMLLARSVVSKAQFMIHHPRRWSGSQNIPESERQFVWQVSVGLLQQYNMMRSNPSLKRFSWYTAYYFPWQTFIYVLDTVRVTPLMAGASDVWQIIEETIENFPGLIMKIKEMPCVAVSKLCLKAYDAYVEGLKKEGGFVPRTPAFINNIKQQQERLQRQNALRKRPGGRREPATTEFPTPQNSTQGPVRETAAHFSNQKAMHIPADTPSAWSTGGVESVAATMSMDVEGGLDGTIRLDEGNGIDIFADQAIDWSQWDKILGDPTLMPMPIMTDPQERDWPLGQNFRDDSV